MSGKKLTAIRVRGMLAAPLADDKRDRLRLIVAGGAGRPLWDSVSAAIRRQAPGDETRDLETKSGVFPCVWRSRWGKLLLELPSDESFAADRPPVLETYITAPNSRGGRARLLAAREKAGGEVTVVLEVRPYQFSSGGLRIAGVTLQLASIENHPGTVRAFGFREP